MNWSYSSLKEYENCARRYHELRVLKNYKREDTEQTLYGEELHKAADKYVKDGVALPEQFSFMQPLIEALMQKQGKKFSELQLALTVALEPCAWKSKTAWYRGIIDLMILDEESKTAWIVDYKTGSAKYPDKDQLDLMSLLVFAHFPYVEQVNSALIFVVKNVFIKHKRLRKEIDTLWWDYRNRVARIEQALATGIWNPTKSGLCMKYCPVVSCEYNGRN
jgi:hypothetical protein